MQHRSGPSGKPVPKTKLLLSAGSFLAGLAAIIGSFSFSISSCEQSYSKVDPGQSDTLATPLKKEKEEAPHAPPIDTAAYDKKLIQLANGDTSGRWPAKTPYPVPGAILPFKRIVAFYGNLYSKRMGILGELPPREMLAKLKEEVKNWKQLTHQLR